MTLEVDVDREYERFKQAQELPRKEFVKERADITKSFGEKEWKEFIRHWAEDAFEIPEVIRNKDVRSLLGDRVYLGSEVAINSSGALFQKVVPNYGVLNDEKCQHFIESNGNERFTLTKSFFKGDQKKSNALALLKYSWDSRWSQNFAIPELVGYHDIRLTVGTSLYQALEVGGHISSNLLGKVIPEYGVFNDKKCELFITCSEKQIKDRLEKAFFGGEHKDSNVNFSIEYAWNNHWSRNHSLLESVTIGDVQSTLGRNIGITEENKLDFFRRVFSDYGKLDDNKCKDFFDRNSHPHRGHLSSVFFSAPEAVANASKIIEFAWEHLWSSEYPIPELISQKEIIETVGTSVYGAFELPFGDSQALFSKIFPDHEILDDNKCRIFLDLKGCKSRSKLYWRFFGRQSEDNLQKLVHYTWEHVWSETREMIELVGSRDIGSSIGNGVFSAAGVTRGSSSGLLSKVFSDYGKLDDAKATTYLSLHQQGPPNKYKKLPKIFFQDSDHTQQNLEHYLEAYQQHHGKRRADLTKDDFKRMPKEVASYAQSITQTINPIKTDGAYNVIQIQWNEHVEQTLEDLYATHGDDLFQEKNLLWEELGVTPFSAKMKASSLGLIPKIEFSEEPSLRTPHYHFVEHEGYVTFDEMVSGSLEDRTTFDVTAFKTPVHGQGIHVQLPIEYKGKELNNYSEQEQSLLRVVATYVQDPNSFERVRDNGKPHFQAPEELVEPHCLVPVIQNDQAESLTKIYLPSQYIGDIGGIIPAVLHDGENNIFFWKLNEVGKIK